ncbi:hypothetical protein H0H87_004340 [Tephrocybe sp. NHM501043]|nr:hypothetical protein H0H87_004340 [Tephrocybe sp. NHM501043]
MKLEEKKLENMEQSKPSKDQIKVNEYTQTKELEESPPIQRKLAPIATTEKVDYQLLNNLSAHPSKLLIPLIKNSTSAMIADIPDIILTTHDSEPTNVKEALNNDLWKESMQKELDQLKKLSTYEINDLPPGQDAIKSKWV